MSLFFQIKLHPSPSVTCQNIEIQNDIQLLECRFIVTDTGYRFIQLESQKDLDFPFDVYDVSLSAKVKKDTNGQLLDITFDKDGIAFIEDDLIQTFFFLYIAGSIQIIIKKKTFFYYYYY